MKKGKQNWEKGMMKECPVDHNDSTNLTLRYQRDGIIYEYCEDCGWINFKQLLEKQKEEILKKIKGSREDLAELEHEQWITWTSYILNQWDKFNGDALEFINFLREEWMKNWKPYQKLTEEEKDKDRIWADKVLDKLKI